MKVVVVAVAHAFFPQDDCHKFGDYSLSINLDSMTYSESFLWLYLRHGFTKDPMNGFIREKDCCSDDVSILRGISIDAACNFCVFLSFLKSQTEL